MLTGWVQEGHTHPNKHHTIVIFIGASWRFMWSCEDTCPKTTKSLSALQEHPTSSTDSPNLKPYTSLDTLTDVYTINVHEHSSQNTETIVARTRFRAMIRRCYMRGHGLTMLNLEPWQKIILFAVARGYNEQKILYHTLFQSTP